MRLLSIVLVCVLLFTGVSFAEETKASITELKSMAYDMLVQIEMLQIKLRQINNLIAQEEEKKKA